VGAVFGLGFPPFRGGPFRHADALGTGALLEELRRLEEAHGPRFAPAPLRGARGTAGEARPGEPGGGVPDPARAGGHRPGRGSAAEQGLPQLGAVLPYGALVAPLQQRWLALAAGAPRRLHTRFGTPVHAIRSQADGVELDCGEGPVVERFDLAVVAEGGVFAEQDRKSLRSDYHQNAWVGTVRLAAPGLQGLAIERFTRNGPLALLPLPEDATGPRAALVWCLPQAEDDIATLTDAQRLTVIQQQLPAVAGRLTGISPLKCFALGLNAETRLLQGRALRIGNAAQTLHPVAGQGLNLGLRDAQALVDALHR